MAFVPKLNLFGETTRKYNERPYMRHYYPQIGDQYTWPYIPSTEIQYREIPLSQPSMYDYYAPYPYPDQQQNAYYYQDGYYPYDYHDRDYNYYGEDKQYNEDPNQLEKKELKPEEEDELEENLPNIRCSPPRELLKDIPRSIDRGLPPGYLEQEILQSRQRQFTEYIQNQVKWGEKSDVKAKRWAIKQFYESITASINEHGVVSFNNIQNYPAPHLTQEQSNEFPQKPKSRSQSVASLEEQ